MSWLSLLPPLVAILIALWRREVLLALLCSILLAELILAGGHPLQGLLQAIERIATVPTSADNARWHWPYRLESCWSATSGSAATNGSYS